MCKLSRHVNTFPFSFEPYSPQQLIQRVRVCVTVLRSQEANVPLPTQQWRHHQTATLSLANDFGRHSIIASAVVYLRLTYNPLTPTLLSVRVPTCQKLQMTA